MSRTRYYSLLRPSEVLVYARRLKTFGRRTPYRDGQFHSTTPMAATSRCMVVQLRQRRARLATNERAMTSLVEGHCLQVAPIQSTCTPRSLFASSYVMMLCPCVRVCVCLLTTDEILSRKCHFVIHFPYHLHSTNFFMVI